MHIWTTPFGMICSKKWGTIFTLGFCQPVSSWQDFPDPSILCYIRLYPNLTEFISIYCPFIRKPHCHAGPIPISTCIAKRNHSLVLQLADKAIRNQPYFDGFCNSFMINLGMVCSVLTLPHFGSLAIQANTSSAPCVDSPIETAKARLVMPWRGSEFQPLRGAKTTGGRAWYWN